MNTNLIKKTISDSVSVSVKSSVRVSVWHNISDSVFISFERGVVYPITDYIYQFKFDNQ
jgi:hypothetical protein